MPDSIHDRLKHLKDSKEYDKIMENFYNVMIKLHKIRSETYHTELAKIYLKKVLANQSQLNESQYKEFREFIRDTTSMYCLIT